MSNPQKREPRGQALVEFALIIPIFILVLVGLFDGARAVYAYSTVANVARTAAREAIVDQTPAAVRAAGHGVASGIRVAVDPVPCNETDCAYTVTAACRYSPMMPGLSAIFTPVISSSVSMSIETKNPETAQTTPVSEGLPTC